MFDLAAKRQLNRGYNDGLARAIEIVATPLLFGLFGRLLDGWFGTEPLLMIVVGTLGVVGIFTKLWIGYDRTMREHEAKLPGAAGDGAGGHVTAAAPVVATGDGAGGPVEGDTA